MIKNRNFKEVIIEDLKDSNEARAYLEVSLETFELDQDSEAFLMTLRPAAEAQG